MIADGPGKTLANSAATPISRCGARTWRADHGTGDRTAASDPDRGLQYHRNAADLSRERGEARTTRTASTFTIRGGRPVNVAAHVSSRTAATTRSISSAAPSPSRTASSAMASTRAVSLLNNDVNVPPQPDHRLRHRHFDESRRSATEATPFLNLFENCTIVRENHPTNTGDGDVSHSASASTRGTNTAPTDDEHHRAAKNCIISAEQPVLNDYADCRHAIPADELHLHVLPRPRRRDCPAIRVPAGTGNIAAESALRGLRRRTIFICRPARPAATPAIRHRHIDPDGSRADMGALPFGVSGGSRHGVRLVARPAARIASRRRTTVPPDLTLHHRSRGQRLFSIRTCGSP